MAAKSTTRTAGYILLGFVMLGLMAFGTTNFGRSVSSIGKVGDTDIPARRYYSEALNQLRAFQAATGQQITFADARTYGVDQMALARVIADSAADNEAARIGLSIGDETLRDQLVKLRDFQGPGGGFDADTYRFVLQQNGLTPAEFETDLRAETARGMLMRAVAAGAALPAIYTDTLFAHARESRNFTWARLGTQALETEPAQPGEAELTAWYEDHPADYTLPEIRHITYAWARPEAFVDQVETDEADLRALYDERLDEYNRPERRLVERLVFGTMQDAQAAMDAINSGESDFATLVGERGLTLADIDLGDVSKADLGPAGDAVFALSEPGLAGPVQSALGPAIFRMNAILAAQERPFEDVRDALRAEFAADGARRIIADLTTELDDLLASGATLEELAGDHPAIEIGKLDWSAGDEDGLAAYEEVRQALASLGEGDFPELAPLADGGLFALRLDSIEAPRLQTLDEVRGAVAEAWLAAERLRLIREQAEALVGVLDSGAESPSSLGMTEIAETGITRDAFIEGTPPDLVTQVFTLEEGSGWQVIGDDNGALLVRLDGIFAADQTTQEATDVKARFSTQMAQDVALDLQTAFTDALESQAGISLDQAMVSAVNNQIR